MAKAAIQVVNKSAPPVAPRANVEENKNAAGSGSHSSGSYDEYDDVSDGDEEEDGSDEDESSSSSENSDTDVR